MKTPRALVLKGDGINCELETAFALEKAGFRTRQIHLNDLSQEGLEREGLLKHFDVLALPGGFSFADDLGSGKVLALKLKHFMNWDLAKFAQSGGLVIGICNGFQALIKLGVFDHPQVKVSITHNKSGKFLNRWARLKVMGQHSRWLKGVDQFELPIRHGEGRIIFSNSEALPDSLGCLKYEEDVNGSTLQLAGLSDSTGRILGLMPHPEAFVRSTQHPEWTTVKKEALGMKLFENAYLEGKQRL